MSADERYFPALAPPAVCLALRVLMVMIQKPSAAGRRCAGRCAVIVTGNF